ncbi:uroporphyrinogen decarboxylase family protein [Desulfitibacter alkalitolerans]|uniref:uroporphyrinogen decarboxylase family protein n=1 Tax=Desulfitibacter alkalitolerans TaxID=264641 RepID=UPI00047FEF7A|nr:uroporphyrinogen decarboxylase family protein [Desulfitibacter alkalitolerans]
MTGRERLLCTLQRQIPDRVPIGLFVQEEFLAYFFPDRKKVDRVIEGTECARILGFDIITRSHQFSVPYFLKKSYLNWEVEHKSEIKNGNLYNMVTIHTPKGTLKQVEGMPYNEKTSAGTHAATMEYLIKDERDFEIFQKYIPKIDGKSIKEMKENAVQTQKTIGDTGISAPWGWCGVYNVAATYRNLQDLLIDPYTNKDFYEAYMAMLTKLIVENTEYLADTDFDCIGIQGNIANSAMIGPEYFDRFILPYEKQVVDVIRNAGKYALYHNCGKAKVLQNSYVKLGVDIWETIAEHPQGDNNLEEAKRLIGDKLILSGNLDQVEFLKKASLTHIEERVAKIMHIGKPGGNYIFACSDYLERDTPLESIAKVIEVAKREGKY